MKQGVEKTVIHRSTELKFSISSVTEFDINESSSMIFFTKSYFK